MLLKKSIIYIILLSVPLFSGITHLQLSTALSMLKKNNLELKIAHFEEQMKAYEAKAATAQNFGSLELTMMGMRSNDAGNVFGYKLQSREATFGDFGAAEFMNATGMNGGIPPATAYTTPPSDLNYPEARNHFLTKVTYQVPLYTGGKLSEYGRITKAMQRMSQYDSQKLLSEKVFQTKKAFYDISLVEHYIVNLQKIIQNISHLEKIVQSMKGEGYAQDIDTLEVQARKSEVESLYNQAKLNRELAYQFLSFLLNQKVESITQVTDMAPMEAISDASVADQNIDIQKAKLGLKVSQMAVNLERSSFLPTVGAFGEYGSADNTLWNDFEEKDSYTVGVQLKWNIFNGGADAAKLEKAQLNYLKVQDQLALAKAGIALKIKKLRTEILSKDADVRSYRKQLEFAHKVYINYHGRYKEGVVSISDVLMKQSKEIEVLLKLLTVKNERNTKIFELNTMMNRG